MGSCDWIASRLTMAPPPCATMARAAAWLTRKVPVRFVPITSLHSSRHTSSTRVRRPWLAALFTRMSMRPRAVRATSTTRRASAGLERSAGTNSARRPAARRRPASASPRARSRPTMATAAPRSERCVAIVVPMPRVAPVTTAALFAKGALIVAQIVSVGTPQLNGPRHSGAPATVTPAPGGEERPAGGANDARMGLELGVTTYGYLYRRTLEGALRAIAAAGYTLVEISTTPPHIFTPGTEVLERWALRRLLQSLNLRCAAVNAAEQK